MPLGLSHFNEHKFKRGFNDIINPICTCGGDIESINHLFFHCSEYCEARKTFLDNIQSIDKMLWSQNDSSLTRLLLYGDPKHNFNVNAFILNSANELILSSGKINERLLNETWDVFFLSLIYFSYGFLNLLSWFFYYVLLFLICAYIASVCNFLHLPSLVVSFVVINFYFLCF